MWIRDYNPPSLLWGAVRHCRRHLLVEVLGGQAVQKLEDGAWLVEVVVHCGLSVS